MKKGEESEEGEAYVPFEAKEITKVKKRTGDIAEFELPKITRAIFLAAQSVGGKDYKQAELLAKQVYEYLKTKEFPDNIPSIEDLHDAVEKILIKNDHAKTAKAYILYREEKKRIRAEKRKILNGIEDDSDFSLNQLRIAEAKYLKRDESGVVIETPLQMFRRVAKVIAKPDYEFYGPDKGKDIDDEFFNAIRKLEFIPGGRTLANAGVTSNQLANCFVVPIGDSMEDIFDAVKAQAIIQKTGGGTGFDFSSLRPAGDRVIKSNGVASGPVSFINVFNAATDVIMQGNRRGANMGCLRVDHPNIIEFVTAKDDLTKLTNFNISVSVTDKFMEAVKKNATYELINPKDKKAVKTVNARSVFNLIVQHAWKTGEPGVLYIDIINADNKIKHIGIIEATNPCGEVPLLPYEVCNLGSVNLDCMVTEERAIDWAKIRRTVRTGIRFLDNVIDAGTYPLPQINEMAKKTRRIGLGILGFADMLYQIGIRYNSEEGVRAAETIIRFIKEEAMKMSQELAEEKGVFPVYKGSEYEGKKMMRNCALLSIAPTGTLSMLAETSGGCEPNFALCYNKYSHSLGQKFVYVNKHFEKAAREQGFYSEELMQEIARKGSIQDIEEIPQKVKDVFVISYDISPEWHIRIQAAFQKDVDNAISKTINFQNSATMEDVAKGFLLAYELGCKGCTVYRDGSRENQVLCLEKGTAPKKKEEAAKEHTFELSDEALEKINNEVKNGFGSLAVNLANGSEAMYWHAASKACVSNPYKQQESIASKKLVMCPDCSARLVQQEGCVVCPSCGFSGCSL